MRRRTHLMAGISLENHSSPGVFAPSRLCVVFIRTYETTIKSPALTQRSCQPGCIACPLSASHRSASGRWRVLLTEFGEGFERRCQKVAGTGVACDVDAAHIGTEALEVHIGSAATGGVSFVTGQDVSNVGVGNAAGAGFVEQHFERAGETERDKIERFVDLGPDRGNGHWRELHGSRENWAGGRPHLAEPPVAQPPQVPQGTSLSRSLRAARPQGLNR